jgi:hypothetical protein
MKATLSFDLTNNDDRLRHLQCVKSQDMAIALHKISEAMYKAHDCHKETTFLRINSALEDIDLEELT